MSCEDKDVEYQKGTSVHCLLTSLSGTFALNVHMAPLSVLFERAALFVAATAVVALEWLLYCEQRFQVIINI